MRSYEKEVVIEIAGFKIRCIGNYTPEYRTGNYLDPPDPPEFELIEMIPADDDIMGLIEYISVEYSASKNYDIFEDITQRCLDEME